MTSALPPLCKGEQYQKNHLCISQPQAPRQAMVHHLCQHPMNMVHPLCQHPMDMVHPLISTF